MNAATLERETPPAEQSAPRGALTNVVTSEPAILAAMLASLGLFYLGPGLLSVGVGLLAFFALTLYRPALSLAMVPLVAPLFYMPRDVGGKVFSLAEVVIACNVAAWALRDGWLAFRTRRIPNLARTVRNPAILLAALLLLIGIAWLLVPAPEFRNLALREFRWTILEPVLFFALMLRWLKTERDIWRMVAAWLIGAALVGREGVEQFLYGQTWSMEGVGRVTSIYPSATSLGIYLGRPLALALVLAALLPAERVMWRVGSALLAVGIGLGLLFSFARGAWIGVFVALVIVTLITRNRLMLAGVGALVVAGLAALPFVGADRIRSIFDWSTPDNTGVARVAIWESALGIIRDHPLLGIGQDQFLRVDPAYGVPHVRFLVVSHPHNWLLDFWLRLGLPGLLWAIVAISLSFAHALQFWRAHAATSLGALALGLLAAVTDFAVHGLLDMAYFTMDNALSLWLLVGLLVLVRNQKSEISHLSKADF